MSESLSDCCSPCCPPVAPTINIPGSTGASAYTFTTANFVVPAVNATVPVSVFDTSMLVVGENVILPGPANFRVTAITSGISVTLQFLNYNGDVAVGSTISGGALLTPAGAQGINAFAVTTAAFVIPAALANVTVAVFQSQMLAVGENVFASDGTHFGNFKVVSLPTTSSVQLEWLNFTGDSATGSTIAAGALIVPALVNPVPVAAGGTGSSTAAGARTNLGAAASGANGDITSLTGITTPLPISEGGTGQTTAAAALAALAAAPLPIANGGTGQASATTGLAALITAGKTGTFVANGATAVVVANANVTASSVIIFTLKTVGGTPAGAPFCSAITATTGFSVKAVAGDTSTYNYVVIN